MKTLRDAKIGDTVRVVKLHGEGAVKRRIMDMGITKGVEIYVRKVAPLGDPVEINVRNYELSLRKADAEMIEVESTSRNSLSWKSELHLRGTRTAGRPRFSTLLPVPINSSETGRALPLRKKKEN